MNADPHAVATPSAWVVRWAGHIPERGRVLDLASGSGRHARYLAAQGHPVVAVDRDPDLTARLAGIDGIEVRVADLEAGPWPCADQRFAGIVVTNYLHRPLLPAIVEALGFGGVLIYETFAMGNERYGRPSNPAYLLQPGELLEVAREQLRVIAYEDVIVADPRPAAVQRICAVRFL